LRAALFTREYPPNIYGGAGVHVDYVSRELAKQIEVEIHCWRLYAQLRIVPQPLRQLVEVEHPGLV
jgi:hypothetical protein